MSTSTIRSPSWVNPFRALTSVCTVNEAWRAKKRSSNHFSKAGAKVTFFQLVQSKVGRGVAARRSVDWIMGSAFPVNETIPTTVTKIGKINA